MYSRASAGITQIHGLILDFRHIPEGAWICRIQCLIPDLSRNKWADPWTEAKEQYCLSHYFKPLQTSYNPFL